MKLIDQLMILVIVLLLSWLLRNEPTMMDAFAKFFGIIFQEVS